MSEDPQQCNTIHIRYFWRIAILLAVLIFITGLAAGNQYGIRRMEIAQQFGHDAAVLEYPGAAYVQAGHTFCYDKGTFLLSTNDKGIYHHRTFTIIFREKL